MRMLVKRELPTAEVEDVFMVAFRESLRHTAVGETLVARLENDLRRSASQVEDCRSLLVLWAANVAQEVVGGDPGVDAFVGAVHDCHALLLPRDDRERILRFEVVSHGFQDSITLFFAQLAKTSCRLDGYGG